jgi:hypothetical protein
LAALKNVATGGKGSRAVRAVTVQLAAEDVSPGSCPRGATSDPVDVNLLIVDDDGDTLINRTKGGFVWIGQTKVSAKFGVAFEGPKNCKDSAVPTANVSHGDLLVTATTDDGVEFAVRRINCRR